MTLNHYTKEAVCVHVCVPAECHEGMINVLRHFDYV